MHHQIDSLAQLNRLRALPPEHKLGFAAALFLLGYLAPDFVQALMVLWLFIWIVQYAQIPASIYLKLLSLPVVFLILSLSALVLGFGLLNNRTSFEADIAWGIPLGSMYVYLSQQGIEQARVVFFRAIALTSCSYFILLTVPLFEIIRVLNRLGCPALITELMVLMYRFIFTLANTAGELLTAQQARMGYGTWRVGMRSLGLLVGQLLQRTLHHYQQMSLGLAARGYRGELRVWHRRRYRANRRYIAEAIAGYFVLLTLTGWHYWRVLC